MYLMTSKEFAEIVGRKHKDVKRDIKEQIYLDEPNYFLKVKDDKTYYKITYEGIKLLSMQYTYNVAVKAYDRLRDIIKRVKV